MVSAEKMEKWQQQVYNAIIETYLKQKANYDEKIAALAMQRGTAAFGRNPLENLRVVKEELKKLVLMMLVGNDLISRNSFFPTNIPFMRLNKARENGAFIQFFENVFEWTNMTYVFYPYFWGRFARWTSAVHFTDPDPDFAAFLKAGAARIQVPVRKNFEKAIVHFCQFGGIWNGNDPPLIDDDLYVPIVDEIAANLDKFEHEGAPYPPDAKPWEVRVPTELVLVQNLEEIPGIVDSLSGKTVGIAD